MLTDFVIPAFPERATYSGPGLPGDRSKPEASASALLKTIDPETEYQLVEVKHGLASSHTRFQQIVDGIPVYGSAVSVHQGSDGTLQTLHMAVDRSLNGNQSFAPQIDFQTAVSATTDAVGITEPYLSPTGQLVWYHTDDGDTKLAWEVNASAMAPLGDFHTIVDAVSGNVLLKENRMAFATGTGDVFAPNPYQTQGSGTGLVDNNDANSTALEAQYQTVTLERLDSGTGLIKGQWADLSTLNSPSLPDTDANEASRVYQYSRDDPRFEQVVIYHAVDSIQAYFHALGFDDDTGIANGIRDFPTLANAHWFTDDQSFYSTANDAIHFGDGGVDDGEDADIIAHEYGHAVQHDQNMFWGGGEMGAMGEGFGDYLAASFYADHGDPAFQGDHAAAVGEWDATSYSTSNPPNLRRVDGDKMYPDDLVNAVHADGEIWSAALWDIRAALGGPTTDQLVLEHHFALPANATMPDAAQAILTADINLNGGANQLAIRQAFVDRGILEVGPAGQISFDEEIYNIGDAATVTLADTDLFGTGTVSVILTTSGGDSEAISLTESAGEFLGTISSAAGSSTNDNGILEVQSGDQVTVTYNDADDGTGNPAVAADTATYLNFTSLLEADFSDDVGNPFDEGFTVSGTSNEWHLSVGRGSDVGHSTDDSFYFGSGEGPAGGGSHDNFSDGTITSPEIDLTLATAADLSFSHFLESEEFYDFAYVSVIHSSGTTVIADSGTGSLPIVTSGFETVRLSLNDFLGQTVQIAFRFTSDISITNEGWYVDDVIVRAVVPAPQKADLVATAFNVLSDHVLQGQTDVTFVVQNTGNADAGAFAAEVVWSGNEILGDSDDSIVAGSRTTFASGLAAGAGTSGTISLQLDRAVLLAHANSKDIAGLAAGTRSQDIARLFLIVDTDNAVAEESEVNNFDTGHLVDSDDITYFPWDTDGNGTVTPLEALNAIQAVGTSSLSHDLDGNGIVTPLEALSVLQRIGYIISADVSESSVQSLPSPAPESHASHSTPRIAPIANVADSGSRQRLHSQSETVVHPMSTGSRRRHLFDNPSTERDRQMIYVDPRDDISAVDEHFSSVINWIGALNTV